MQVCLPGSAAYQLCMRSWHEERLLVACFEPCCLHGHLLSAMLSGLQGLCPNGMGECRSGLPHIILSAQPLLSAMLHGLVGQCKFGKGGWHAEKLLMAARRLLPVLSATPRPQEYPSHLEQVWTLSLVRLCPACPHLSQQVRRHLSSDLIKVWQALSRMCPYCAGTTPLLFVSLTGGSTCSWALELSGGPSTHDISCSLARNVCHVSVCL